MSENEQTIQAQETPEKQPGQPTTRFEPGSLHALLLRAATALDAIPDPSLDELRLIPELRRAAADLLYPPPKKMKAAALMESMLAESELHRHRELINDLRRDLSHLRARFEAHHHHVAPEERCTVGALRR